MGAMGAARACLLVIIVLGTPVSMAYPWELPVQHAESAAGPGWSSYRFGDLDQPIYLSMRAEGGNERVLGLEVVDSDGRVILRAEGRSSGALYELRITDAEGGRHVLRQASPGWGSMGSFAWGSCGGWASIGAGRNVTSLALEIDCPTRVTIGAMAWAVGDAIATREVQIRARHPVTFDALHGDGGLYYRPDDFGGPAASLHVGGVFVGASVAATTGGAIEATLENGFHGSFASLWSDSPGPAVEMSYASPTRSGACPCAFDGAALDPGLWTFRLSGVAVTDDELRLAGVDARYP